MRARLALAALTLSTFAYVTTETMPIGLLPQMAGGLGVSPSAVGLLVTAYGLVVVLVTVPLTRIVRRWSRRRLLSLLLLVFALATAFSSIAPNYPVLLVARVLTALSQAVFWAVVAPAAAALFGPATRGRAVAILYAGSSLGGLAGVPAGTVVGQQFGWRMPFAVLAVLGLVILAALRTFLPELPAGASESDRGTAPDAGRYRVFVLATALIVTGAFTSFTYITPYLTDVTRIGSAGVAVVLFLRGVAGLGGVAAASFFTGRHARTVMVAGTAVQVVAIGAQYAFGSFAAATVVATCAASFGMAAMIAASGARVLEVAPRGTDMASAAQSTAFNVGITAGALIGSGLLAGPGVRLTALVGALGALAGFAVLAAERALAPRLRPRETISG